MRVKCFDVIAQCVSFYVCNPLGRPVLLHVEADAEAVVDAVTKTVIEARSR